MKRIGKPLLAFMAILIFGRGDPAWAYHTADKSIELHAGLSGFRNPDDSDLNLDSNLIYGAGFELRKGRLSLELSADWMKTDVKQDIIVGFAILPILVVGTVETVKGELTIVPILLTGRLHLGAKDGMIDPYVGLGGGAYLFSYKTSSNPNFITGSTGPTLDINVRNTGGYHADLGVNIKATPNLAFTFDARYVWANAKFTYKGDLTGLNTGHNRLSLDGYGITWGIRYAFQTSSVH